MAEHSFQSFNYPEYYIRHRDFLGFISEISSELDKKDSTFKLVPGLTGDSNTVSFESVDYPGYYLRHQDSRIKLQKNDGSRLFEQDTTFFQEESTLEPGNPDYASFRSVNYPSNFIRHKDFELWVEAGSGNQFKQDSTFKIAAPNY
jgi:hypothetical protein